MKLADAPLVVVTDFGTVKISKKSAAWLASIDPNWEKSIFSKSKKTKLIREKFERFCNAASVAASIEWAAGGTLKEF